MELVLDSANEFFVAPPVPSYVRDVSAGAAWAWCPQRHKHPGALIRMETLWRPGSICASNRRWESAPGGEPRRPAYARPHGHQWPLQRVPTTTAAQHPAQPSLPLHTRILRQESSTDHAVRRPRPAEQEGHGTWVPCPSAELFASAHGDDYLLGSCFLQSGNAVPTLIKTLRLLSHDDVVREK